MKLSLSWVFEHIVGDWEKYNIAELVEKFNRTTAEIETFEELKLPLKKLALAKILAISKKVKVEIPEWNSSDELILRDDAKKDCWFLVRQSNNKIEWATLSDLGASSKEGLLPEMYCRKGDEKGAWKKNIPERDYIFDLDNVSITHRADLWGVYGIAREIAAILNLKLKPLEIKEIKEKSFDDAYKTKSKEGFSIINSAPQACRRFAGLYFPQIERRPSSLYIASMLCRTDNRPIDLLVDLTNYVMLDMSQPMHAFDAHKISTKTVEPRLAKKKEKIKLLDESTLELTSDDLVITDGKKPLALAGVMGGLETGINDQTTSIFLEAANFDSSFIRRTSSRYHLRTEASARFEKGLDPNQNVVGIKRLLKLLDEEKVNYKHISLISLGKPFKPYRITISHEVIEDQIGMAIPKKFVPEVLKKIGFEVKAEKEVYHLDVPTFRGVKNVTIAEDIVEEVGRFWGWDKIPFELPTRKTEPIDIHDIRQVRAIKQQLAFGVDMHEVCNYPFFDESFLREINWQPHAAVRARNPLSQNVTCLVTSLIPHLCKNVQQNITKQEGLRFFELNRIWHLKKKDEAVEAKSLAGVLWDYQGTFDFYKGKDELASLFDLLRMNITWKKVKEKPAGWYNQYQTASLWHEKDFIGYVGLIDELFAEKIGPGNAFIFELDAHYISHFRAPEVRFKPLPRYPYVYHDVSMWVPITVTVQEIEKVIHGAHKLIYQVELRDMFEKKELADQRSLTFRFYIRDPQKTLARDDIDKVNAGVMAAVKSLGVTIR